jgi:pyruvate dehydrogenase E2 component (dihydrolipoamide acetyltransferase)
MQTIIMPKMGDAMEEGTLVRWLKHEGDTVQEGEPIAEIATDKATVEIEAPTSGVLRGIRVAENAVVPVNTPLAYILQEGESLPADGDGKASAPAKPAEAAAPQPAPAPTTVAAAPQPAPAPTNGEERILASPLARKIAAEHGIDLRQVQGTGPKGRIVERDVLAHLEARRATAVPAAAAPAPTPAPAPAVAAAPAEGRTETLTRLRQITAQRTTEAHQTIPHFYLTMEIDMEEAVALRQRLNQLDESLRISVNDLIVKACAVAIEQHPIVNATYQNGQLVHPNGVHIGIAVAVEQGLLVAVLRHCEGKSLRRIAQESQSLIQKAREGKLMPDEMMGNTFTVSNLGMFGIEQFTAIINPPASAILAVGATKRVPVVQEDGSIVVRQRMKVTHVVRPPRAGRRSRRAVPADAQTSAGEPAVDGVMRRAARGFLWLSLLVALATVIGSGLLFGGVQNLPPLDYNRLSMQLGIALVVLGIGASLLHMAHTQGWRATLWLLSICVVLAGSIELIGTLTGFPFGPYTYTERLGPKFLGHVPYLIPPSWFMMLYPALHLSFMLGVSRRWAPLSAGALLTLWDVAMDAAVSTSRVNPGAAAFVYWFWDVDGAFYGMPLQNWLGWFATGALLSWLYLRIVPEWRESRALTPLGIWLVQGGAMAGLAFWIQRPLATALWLLGACIVVALTVRSIRSYAPAPRLP